MTFDLSLNISDVIVHLAFDVHDSQLGGGTGFGRVVVGMKSDW